MAKATPRLALLATLQVVLIVSCLRSSAEEPVPFHKATFSYSTEPEKVLIHVTTMGMTPTLRTLALYGDGRLVRRLVSGGVVSEERARSIEPADVERLLRIAVDNGLAEWDMTRVQAQQLEKNNGKLYLSPDDSSRVTILLSIEDYERGDYKLKHVEEKVQFQGAFFMIRHFPPILEIQGITQLIAEMEQLAMPGSTP